MKLLKNNPYLLLYLGLVLLLTTALSRVPGHNGDLPFYIECMIERAEGNSPDLIQKTEKVLRKELPPEEFPKHAARLKQTDPRMLDFYRVKPVYLVLITWLHRIGLGYIFSTVLPSLISYATIALLCFAWGYRITKPAHAFAISLMLMLMEPSTVLARLSTPDGLSNLVILALLYCLYFEKSRIVALFLLYLSVFIRMDNAVSGVVILAGMTFRLPGKGESTLSLRGFLLSIVLLCCSVAATNALLTHDFWWIKQASYLSSPGSYGRHWLIGFLVLSGSFVMAWLLMLVILKIPMTFRNPTKNIAWIQILISIFLARMVFSPFWEERFFTAYYIAGVWMIVQAITTKWTDRSPAI